MTRHDTTDVPLSDLETLLTEALDLRAESLQAADLTPDTPPAVVVPLHRRRPVAGALAVAAAVAAVAGVALTLTDGDDAPRSAPVATAPDTSPDTSPAPPAPPALLPQDDMTSYPAGHEVRFDPRHSAVLVPSRGRFDLRLTWDGVDLQVPVPRARDPYLVDRDLFVTGAIGYLVEEESGDSSSYRLFVISGGDLVEATVEGDLPFGNGYREDGTRYRTYAAGDGTALYTEVTPPGAEEPTEVYSWDVDAEGADLAPVRVR